MLVGNDVMEAKLAGQAEAESEMSMVKSFAGVIAELVGEVATESRNDVDTLEMDGGPNVTGTLVVVGLSHCKASLPSVSSNHAGLS